LFLPVTAFAQGHRCALLYSGDNPQDLVYDSALHTWAVQRIYPGAPEYGWIGCLTVDLGTPDGPAYDDGGIWRQDYGQYATLWQPAATAQDSIEYDPMDIETMWPLYIDEWGDPVTSFWFHRGVGLVITTEQPNECNLDVNGDGIVNPVDVVLLANYVYKNLECVR
jgi:hypothetical protein